MGGNKFETLAQVAFIVLLATVLVVPCVVSNVETPRDVNPIVEASEEAEFGVGSTGGLNISVGANHVVESNGESEVIVVEGENSIVRLNIGAQYYEGHEINRPAVVDGEVYYLYQRPTSRPANPLLSYDNVSAFTFTDDYGAQPQTYWMHYQHGDETVWVGQILQLDASGEIMGLPAATVLLKHGRFYETALDGTVNCNELIGLCVYDGKWYAGERSGGCLNYRNGTYSRGGGLWESANAIYWVRDNRKEDPLDSEFGRELLLATLGDDMYGFYQGEVDSKTLIRRLNTDEDVCESPLLDQGLVPFQIHPGGFDWKGYIPLRTGGDLGWFDGESLQFQSFDAIEGREVWDAIPIGIYNDQLILSVRSGNEYTVVCLSEPFGEPIKIASNWMHGWGVRGVIDGDFAYLGAMCEGYAALDRLLVTVP